MKNPRSKKITIIKTPSGYKLGTLPPSTDNSRSEIAQPENTSNTGRHIDTASIEEPLPTRTQTILSHSLNPIEKRIIQTGIKIREDN